LIIRPIVRIYKKCAHVTQWFLSRYRIMSAATPGMAMGNSFDAKQGPFEDSEFTDRLYRIFRTSGCVPTGMWQVRRNARLI
jgi:hypothetical protein